MIVTIPTGGGFLPDQSQDVPDGSWSNVENMRFSEGYAEKVRGHVEVLNDPTAAAYHIANYRPSTGSYWIHGTLAGTYADDGTTKTDITGGVLTGTADDRITSTVLGGVYVQNNGVNVPEFWGGDTAQNLATLTGWDAAWRAKSIRAFKFYLLALNVTKSGTQYGSMVKWSHAAEPGTIPASWDEADATLDAGEFDVASTSDNIVDGAALGDTFIVYKDSSTYGLQYVGGNDIFTQFRIPGDHGMLAPNCCAQTPMGHVVLTQSDVVLQNGTGPSSIIDGKARRWLFSRIDSTYYARSFVVHNPARQEVWICYPSVGNSACTEALTWNYVSGTFGVRALPNTTAGAWGPLQSSASNTWDADTETWDEDVTVWSQAAISEADKRLMMSSTDSKVMLMDQSGKFNGTAYTQKIERTGMSLGDQTRTKLIRCVYPRIDASAGTVLSIQVGGSMSIERGVAWSPAVSYTVGSSYKADTMASGRFMSIRITSTTSSIWRLKSLDVDYVTQGIY